MRYAILSDVHGNLEAFQAVLDNVETEDIQKIIFLGDIVGYGANPKECMDILREKTSDVVAGNHDWAAAGKTNLQNFNSVAREAIEWTISALSKEHLDFLAQLPLKKEEDCFSFAHSSPLHPQEWNYIFSGYEALRNLQTLKKNLCFVGHSHIPTVFLLTEFEELFFSTSFSEIILEENVSFLINVGSVGQPRDSSHLASYGILDTEKKVFFLKRVDYDIEAAQKKILAAGLPPILAERIGRGW